MPRLTRSYPAGPPLLHLQSIAGNAAGDRFAAVWSTGTLSRKRPCNGRI
ncbi:hypothetical protein [Kibdelosporangium philippinense]